MARWIFPLVVSTLCLTAAAQAKTCKQVGSCEEAVQIWCDGYSRADADKDGIPCENVCHSRQQVEEIQSRISCRQG